MIEKRKLVGRRYEDFLQNNIFLELPLEEYIWKNLVTDYRYQPALDRRKQIRRKSDNQTNQANMVFMPTSVCLHCDELIDNNGDF
jgi:hypothetical protein